MIGKKYILITVSILAFVHLAISIALIWLPKITVGDILNPSLNAINDVSVTGIASLLSVTAAIVYVLIARGIQRSDHINQQVEAMRSVFKTIVADRVIPMKVNIDDSIPISFPEKISIPLNFTLKLSLKEQFQIKTSVPLSTTLPLDTVIETSVLGIGKIKIPIRGNIPINIVIPIKESIQVQSEAMNVQVQDTVSIDMPTIQVPIKSSIKTQIPISLSTLD